MANATARMDDKPGRANLRRRRPGTTGGDLSHELERQHDLSANDDAHPRGRRSAGNEMDPDQGPEHGPLYQERRRVPQLVSLVLAARCVPGANALDL